MIIRSLTLAAAVLALPLAASSAFAQGATTNTGEGSLYRIDHGSGAAHSHRAPLGYNAAAKKKAAASTQHAAAHSKAPYHGQATEEATTSQLNAASLQAAQQGQSFAPTAPPAPAAAAPSKKTM